MKLMLSHSCNILILLAWFVYWTILPSWDSPFLKPCYIIVGVGGYCWTIHKLITSVVLDLGNLVGSA